MPTADSYDRLRDWSLGRLAPDEALLFQRELAANPELRAAADEFALVARWTEPLAADVPESRLRFEDVIEDTPTAGAPPAPVFSMRRVAAAAAALLLVAAGAWALVRTRAPEPVILETVSLARPEGASPPAVLAAYDPVKDGAIQWMDSRDDAQAVAKATHRDVLVYGYFESCPMCRQMERVTFRDASVVEAASQVVPLRIDFARLSKADAEKAQGVSEKGWPYFAIEKSDGTTVKVFSGMYKPPAMKAQIDTAVGAVVPWPRAKEEAIRRGEALEAHDALESARSRAASDAAVARADLEAAAKRLAGTPAGKDLERVLERWKKDGTFPSLVETPR